MAGFVEIKPNSGLDAEAKPPWLVVHDDQTKKVRLHGWEHALLGDFELHSTDPSVATAESSKKAGAPSGEDDTILIRARKPGVTTIQARVKKYKQNVDAELRVRVYKPRVAKVNFYFITNNPAKSERKKASRYNESDVGKMLKIVNSIYSPQAAITFEIHRNSSEGASSGDIDFAKKGQGPEVEERIWEGLGRIRDHFDPSMSHLNVFFLAEWGVRDGRGKLGPKVKDVKGQVDEIGGNLCVIEDMSTVEQQALVLAHELGHLLGARHRPSSIESLLHPNSPRWKGRKIHKQQVKQMRQRWS